jgi:hypothetical protein
MCQYAVVQYTFRQCRAQPKHLIEEHKRVDYIEGLRDEDGVLIPDPCPNSKTGRGLGRMCAEASQTKTMAFGSSSNRGQDTPCPECLRLGSYIGEEPGIA